MPMTDGQRKLALDLFDAGAFLKKESSPEGLGFRLPHHEKRPNDPLSPFKLDLRPANLPNNPGPLTQELVFRLAQEMRDITEAKEMNFDAIVGVPGTGHLFAHAFQNTLPKKYGMILLTMQKNGDQNIEKIDGNVRPDYRVLMIDNQMTDVASKVETIDVIMRHKMKVKYIMVAVDFEQKGSAYLESWYRLSAVFKISELLFLYAWEKKISYHLYEECWRYLGLKA